MTGRPVPPDVRFPFVLHRTMAHVILTERLLAMRNPGPYHEKMLAALQARAVEPDSAA